MSASVFVCDRQITALTRISHVEKGEPKQIRTKVPLLTSLTTYHYAKPAHRTIRRESEFGNDSFFKNAAHPLPRLSSGAV